MIKKKEKITLDKLAERVDKLADMTQSEFLAMRNEFATKDDLKRFATKDDLKRFATKDDLKRFATKDDLKQYATKDDLQKSTIMVLQAIDGVVAKFDKMDQDSAADKLLHDRHETALENHEVRIKVLEKIKH